MSRSGYIDGGDLNDWEMIKWRGQVASAMRGKRGQKFLTDLLAALETLPDKRLIRHELKDETGEVCAIGALGLARKIDMEKIDPEEPVQVAASFDIATQLAQEVVYMNDEYYDTDTPEQRYEKMKAWVAKQIRPANVQPTEAAEPAGGNA